MARVRQMSQPPLVFCDVQLRLHWSSASQPLWTHLFFYSTQIEHTHTATRFSSRSNLSASLKRFPCHIILSPTYAWRTHSSVAFLTKSCATSHSCLRKTASDHTRHWKSVLQLRMHTAKYTGQVRYTLHPDKTAHTLGFGCLDVSPTSTESDASAMMVPWSEQIARNTVENHKKKQLWNVDPNWPHTVHS